ncbi:MAG: TonB-dependent receptor, partial [Flavobacteriaceae bacterium]
HQIRLSLININNDLDYRESNLANSRILGSDLAQKNLSIGGSLKSKWNPVFSTHLHAYHTKYDLTSRSIYESSGQTLEQKNLVDENALKVHTFWNVGTPFLWENGYQFTETSITNQTSVSQPPFESMAKGVVQSHALYSQLRYQSPNKRLLAQTGMRLNYYKNRDSLATFDKFLAEPRLNLSYEIVKDLTVEALGEFKSQATHQIVDLEQNFLGVEKRRWILSNEKDLPIITSKQGSLGISYDHNKLYTGLTGFYKKVNGVSISTQGFENEYQFNGEIGEYDVRGVEVLLNAKTEITSAWLSYTYNENTYEYDALDPNRFPNNFDVRHDVTFGGIVTMDSFKLAFGINYRTGKPYTQPDGESPLNTSLFPTRINYQPPNSSRLPEYFRADASALYDFKLSDGINAKVGLSVLNFTNRKNILDTYYRLTDDNQIETIETVSLGLTPNFSFRVGF